MCNRKQTIEDMLKRDAPESLDKETVLKGLDKMENMKIDLKKIEILEANSDETLCFSARLYINGEFAATVHNNGQGEANRYYFNDPKIRDDFFSYCRNLPDFDSPYGPLSADEDLVIGDLIEKKLSAQI